MQNYQVKKSNSFIRDLKCLRHRPKIIANVNDAISQLENGEKLPMEHFLKGKLKGLKECHLQCGLLLVWAVNGSVVKLLRLGTHHRIFGL
ncbi:MAG: type II toxin-antitoxin system YafQ family toxin [Bacteroidaceae bacterium]|nr:type II toxin-antitoxin system YafQ family toxin [Bacteroidaceae bacterium]